MSLSIFRRRRKILLTALALVAGGYATYQLYKSPVMTRRRKQLHHIFKSLSFLGDAVSQSAESLSIVSDDLKAFITSDVDEVPRSLRQAFKIGQCPEFKQSLIVFCTALTEGALQGTNIYHRILGRGDSKLIPRKLGFDDVDANVGAGVLLPNNRKDHVSLGVEGPCQEANVVRCVQNKCEVGGAMSLKRKSFSQGADCEQRSTSAVDEASCGGLQREYTWEIKPSLFRCSGRAENRERGVEGFADRFLQKLFTDAGAGFASVVVGSVARNLVLTLLGGLQNDAHGQGSVSILKVANVGRMFAGKPFAQICQIQTEMSPQVIDADLHAVSGTFGRQTSTLDLLCSDKGRSFIAECIQNFVSSAVSVYIEKTKGINYYDDMVAGITNPTHQAPMKELLVSVCNGAVETLVRTAHEVMFFKASAEAELTSTRQNRRMETTKVENGGKETSSLQDETPVVSRHDCPSTLGNDLQEVPRLSGSGKVHGNGSTLVEEEPTLTSFKDAYALSAENSFSSLIDGKQQMQGWIEGVSRTLAIPSNRILVMDVAGKMTSEAVHSVFEVMTNAVSSCFKRRVAKGEGRFDSGIAENGRGHLQIIRNFFIKVVGMKYFVLASICLVFCLHVLFGINSYLATTK